MLIGKDYISTPRGYSMVAVNIFGRSSIMPVPTTVARMVAGAGGAAIGSGNVASCSCTEGTCEVKSYNIPFIGV